MNVNNSTHALGSWIPPISVDTRVALYSILLVWSLLGNVLVIAVVYCNQNLRTNMNYLIVNMAVSDLLVPLIAMPWEISGLIVRPREWLVDGPFGEALCKLVAFLSHISPFVSSISLVIVALQRFIAVVYPTRRPILTRRKRWIVISFPWIVAMVLISPDFYTYRLSNERGYTMCIRSWSPAFDPNTAEIIFCAFITIIGIVIPFIAVTLLYSIMLYKLRKSLKNVMPLIEREMIRSRQRRNRRIFCMSVTIIVLFIICWFPFFSIAWMSMLNHSSIRSMDYDILYKLAFALNLIWYSLAAFNPCIYFVFLRDFRKGLKRIFALGRISTLDAPGHQVEIEARTQQHVHNLTSIPLQLRMNINTKHTRSLRREEKTREDKSRQDKRRQEKTREDKRRQENRTEQKKTEEKRTEDARLSE